MASREPQAEKRTPQSRKTARDVMNRTPICATAQMSVADCARLMREHDIGALPVLDADRQVIGIVSQSDFLRITTDGNDRAGPAPAPHWTDFFASPETAANAIRDAAARRVQDVMTTRVICVRPDMPLTEVATILDEWKIRRVPVIADGRIVGILAQSDLGRSMIDPRRLRVRIAASDHTIRANVVSYLEQLTWLPGGGGIEVTVTDGTVILYGIASSAEEVLAIEYLAEGVPGVRAVESYLRVGQHTKYRN
jgi:CBS domain-containing protein